MNEIHCSRCGSTRAGLEKPPLPGEAGKRVHAQTCAPCWQEWLRTQVMFINEYRLSPARPEDYRRLIGEMSTFLNLRDEEPA